MKNYNKKIMKKYAAIVLMGILIQGMTSCSTKSDTKRTTEKAVVQELNNKPIELTKLQFESSKMSLGKKELKDFHEVVKATGMFDVPPENRVSVSSYYSGTVKEIKLLPGERVKKGQLLFTLENPEFVQLQQDYLEAKGQLIYLKSDFERQKNLSQDNVSSQKTFLKSESDYMVTKVRMQSLSKKLALMNINANLLTLDNIRSTIIVNSPISGYVTQVDISKGAFLNTSQTAINIVNTDELHLELKIFEKDLLKVKLGQAIKFRIQEDKSNSYDASVHLVNKTIDTKDRTVGIHGHLEGQNISNKFNPGMYVEAEIYATSSQKNALPEDALVEIDGKFFALVLSNSSNKGYTFVKKEIKVGATNDGFVEVLNAMDFDENTQFLTNGAFNLITE
jgi:membrane fusion protein, heavy metal efflux system